MPTDPLDMVGDLIKMGLYKDQQLTVADKLNTYELRKALLLKSAGKGDPKREKLVLALAKQAGGIENAFAAAFGPQAGLFFADTVRTSGATRREFLRNVAIGAAIVTLTNCANPEEPDPAAGDDAEPVDTSGLEKTDLKIGFIPITCATPIIMSEPLGFYKEGYRFPPGSKLLQDTGFQGYKPDGVIILQPKKKPRNGELTAVEKVLNRAISSVRVEVEHQIGGVKRSQIVVQKFRNRVENFVDKVMETACGLYNLQLSYRQGQANTTA